MMTEILSRGVTDDLINEVIEKHRTAHCCGKEFNLRKEWIIIFREKPCARCPVCNKFVGIQK